MEELTDMTKSGFVTIIGRPNVGKSTLLNRIVGQKIAITSKKPQTTRMRIRGVYTEERGQIVFVDTPGLTGAKNKLGEYMEKAASSAVRDVDAVIYIVEPSPFIGKGDRAILDLLQKVKVPVILVINKTDTIEKEEVLPVIAAFDKEYDFNQIVPVSALKGSYTDDIIDALFDVLSPGPMYYDEDTVTDMPERAVVSEMIREGALRTLEKEVPHGIAVVVDTMKKRKNSAIIDIDATIICERDSHKGIIIGKGGATLKKIGSMARRQIEEMVGMKVNLKIFVKVKKDWRDSDYLVRNFGYDKREL
ncbi:MAG: GTPase Era [Eubacterium sp.]|nr:GTPase Era [Eubacterium sp.]